MHENRDDLLELPVYGVDAVRRIDHAAIARAGIAGYELMTRAARCAYDVARREFPDAARWQVLCGGGNNAGDGYVLARLARAAGLDADVICLGDPGSLQGDAARAYRDYLAAGGPVQPWGGAPDAGADLVVDALLGSGLSRDVAGAYADAVRTVNRHAAPVLALDVPTGLDGDTGRILGTAVRADVTVTFVGRKTGLYSGAGPECAGRVHFCDLGVPASCRDGVAAALRILTAAGLRAALPPRARHAHKGDFGHVLVVGGAPGMPGAVRLAGEAALRAGAGRVSIATDAAHAALLPTGRPELMCHAVRDAADIEALLAGATVVAIGPGLGRSAWAVALLDAALASALPLVVDADALHLLAHKPASRAGRILTPHPGEAARLLGVSAADIQHDRLHAVRELRARYGGVAVLKGAGTLIAADDGAPWLCPRGNPGMASAGMGDVLTGIVAGLLAQGLAADQAAVAGVEVHARAADVAAAAGERGLVATDVLEELRPWLNP